MLRTFLQSKIGPTALTGTIFASMGILFVVLPAFIAAFFIISSFGTVAASGTIISCTATAEGECEPLVSFRAASGESITFQSSSSSSTFAPGEKVTVLYHPTHPQDAQIDPWQFLPIFLLIFGSIGLAFFLVGTLLFLLAGNHPAAELVQRYFTALENQDYATAFACLSPHMETPERVPLTLNRFIQMQQASERSQGKVTGHVFTMKWSMTSNHLFSFRMAQASFTMKVTRGEKTEEAYPFVVREGTQWKILRFDPYRINLLH